MRFRAHCSHFLPSVAQLPPVQYFLEKKKKEFSLNKRYILSLYEGKKKELRDRWKEEIEKLRRLLKKKKKKKETKERSNVTKKEILFCFIL